jgi:hypothetical protein
VQLDACGKRGVDFFDANAEADGDPEVLHGLQEDGLEIASVDNREGRLVFFTDLIHHTQRSV